MAARPPHVKRCVEYGHRVLEHLFDRPIVTVAGIGEVLKVTPAGANSLVTRLEKLGLLREFTGFARNRRFRFEPYLSWFEERRENVA